MIKEPYLSLYLNDQEITDFVKSNRFLRAHKDIIDHLGLSPHYYVVLKRLFPHLPKKQHKKYNHIRPVKSKLARVDLLVVRSINLSGTVILEPPFWKSSNPVPIVRLHHLKISEEKIKIGDKILVRLLTRFVLENKKNYIEANFLRVIRPKFTKGLGIIKKDDERVSILTTSKLFNNKTLVDNSYVGSLKNGDIVEVDMPYNTKFSKKFTDRILKVHEPPEGISLFSFLAAKEFNLPVEFPDSVHKELSSLNQTEKMISPVDLTHIPFVTIDPVNARDRDDAIYAVFPKNPTEVNSFCEIWIAIADVSSYVKKGSSIDQEAMHRGNSTYFVDSVVPMLPEKISNDLCSLNENEVRNSITLHIILDRQGKKVGHQFIKSKISVKHNCSYEEVENSLKKQEFSGTVDFDKEQLFENLSKANSLLSKSIPGALELNIPETVINLSASFDLIGLYQKESLKSHRIVENFMITANKCAAETLSGSNLPIIFRVHQKPDQEILEKLLRRTSGLGIKSERKKALSSQDLNQLLCLTHEKKISDIVSILILQSMNQAYYAAKEIGHFGLNLKNYVHFTSPIRRYADLITHRLLYFHLGWSKEDKYEIDKTTTELICLHISTTERNSSMAERISNNRYIASLMETSVGKSFDGLVYSSSKTLIFFFLRKFSIQGICSRNPYPNQRRKRKGKKTDKKELISIGDQIKVKLVAVNKLSGVLTFAME